MSGRPDDIALTRELFLEYQIELGIDLCFQGFDEELETLPGRYAPPRGLLLLAKEEGGAVACGALRDLGGGIGEIKRIYVRPLARRRGLARQISVMLIEKARQLGYKVLRLDTLRRLPGATELYQSLGFREIEPYNYNPEPDIVYMERPV